MRTSLFNSCYAKQMDSGTNPPCNVPNVPRDVPRNIENVETGVRGKNEFVLSAQFGAKIGIFCAKNREHGSFENFLMKVSVSICLVVRTVVRKSRNVRNIVFAVKIATFQCSSTNYAKLSAI